MESTESTVSTELVQLTKNRRQSMEKLKRLTSERIEEITASNPGISLIFSDWYGVWRCEHGYLPLSFVQSWFVDSISFVFESVERVADGGDRYVMNVHTRYGWYLISGSSVNGLMWRLQDMALLADAAVRDLPEVETQEDADSLFRFVDACTDAVARGVRPSLVLVVTDGPELRFHVDDVGSSSYEPAVDYAADRGWFQVRYMLLSIISSWGVRDDYFVC
jgi:hypothetical protein